jgi:catechol 2,3-dioxygenase-like lactoylglutathione lyase family enzyme
MAYRPSHVGLCVSDIERSLRFYCEGLGFEVSDGVDLDSDQVPGLDEALEVPTRTVLRSQMIVLDHVKIELLHYTQPAVEGTPSARRNLRGLTHLSFWVDDLDASIQRLLDHGGTLVEGTRQSPGVDLVFVADPDGTRVELMEQPG